MSRLVLTKTAQPNTPATNKTATFVDTNDRKLKVIDDNGVISTLVNDGMKNYNNIVNGGFSIQQRVATAATAIPSASTTTRAGQVADRWAVTTGNTTTCLWTQTDAGTTTETGLLNRHYGRITQNTNAAKFILSQFLENVAISHLRGQKVRLSVKLKQFAGSNAVYRLGLLQLTSSGTIDTCPAFISAIGGASTDPTWGTNLSLITPDSTPSPENGTVSGSALSITSTAAWVRSSAVFSVPASCLNLCPVLYRDTIGSASDSVGVAEFMLTQGPDLVDWVTPPFGEELIKCQRFFSKSFPLTVVAAASLSEATAGSGVTGLLGKSGSATALGSQITIQFPVQMFKTTPTVTLFTPTASGAVVFRLSGTSPLSQGTTAQRTSSLTDRGVVITATNEATTNGAVGDLVAIHYTADCEFNTKMDNLDVSKAAGYVATAGLAAIAGALKYLQQYSGEEKPPWNWRIFAVQVTTAILAGKIAEWLFDGWKFDHNIVLAAIALSGWGGAQAISLAQRKLGPKTGPEDFDAKN